MALAQLNLKIPPAVLERWREQARAAGHDSIRDWLLALTAAPAEACAELPLRDRVARLEQAVEALQQARPASRRVDAPPVAPRPAPAPAAAPPAAPVPAGGIETAALADLLGIRRGTLNAQIARAGGAAPGLVLHGWRCLGQRVPDRGGPSRAVWEPAGT